MYKTIEKFRRVYQYLEDKIIRKVQKYLKSFAQLERKAKFKTRRSRTCF